MKTPNLTAIALALTLVIPLLVSACGKTVGQTIDDATITTRVKTALLNDPDVGGMRGGLRIDVDTFKGVVTLSGAVRSAEERDKAIAIARKIYGVTDVKSTLQIEGIKQGAF
jgi:hyperosmotically inducible periplasmic protein